MWGRLGWQDIKRRYRRTVIGPFWNIVTCGLFLSMSRSEVVAKTPAIAEFTELGDYLHLPVRTCSAGIGDDVIATYQRLRSR
jgi:hypothetical protein